MSEIITSVATEVKSRIDAIEEAGKITGNEVIEIPSEVVGLASEFLDDQTVVAKESYNKVLSLLADKAKGAVDALAAWGKVIPGA